MKKIFFLVILLAGITKAKHAFAQNNPNTVFDIPDDKFRRQFTVELDRGNKMQVSVTDIHDLDFIRNIDSIVKILMKELALVKDSLSFTGARNIDYNMDMPHVKKLRIRKTPADGNYYAFINGAPAELEMQQDTIVIHGKIPEEWLRRSTIYKEKHYGKYYFSVSFYLNDIDDLMAYKEGLLNEKIRIIQQNYKGNWEYREDERLQLKKYPEITSNTPRGYIIPQQPFIIKKSIEVQNYKNYFIPSISATPVFVMESDFIKKEIGASLEAAFSFEKPDAANTKTHVNLFAGIEYNVTPLTKQRYWAKFYPYVSVAYLVHRSGTVYDKNSFRVILGNFNFGNISTRIQPAIYFNNLFKNITPSLRIVQRF